MTKPVLWKIHSQADIVTDDAEGRFVAECNPYASNRSATKEDMDNALLIVKLHNDWVNGAA